MREENGREAPVRLPLREVSHAVRVRGYQSEVMVSQRFGNDLDRPVEAVYVFPLPAEAKVDGVEARIGNRTIHGELRRRDQAREEYARARDAGHHAALVEEERPNIFTMSVGGIEPGEEIEVSVRYHAPVDFQAGGGRLHVPLVVAPRFIPGVATGKQAGGWALDTDEVPDASRVTPQVVERVDYTATVDLDLVPGFAVHLASPSHPEIFPARDLAADDSVVIVADNLRPDRDVVITYASAEARPTLSASRTAFTAPDGVIEEFVLLELATTATATSQKPLTVLFALDRSGSMEGQKIAGLRKVVAKALRELEHCGRPVRAAIMPWNDEPLLMVPFSPIGPEHYAAVEHIKVQGGTELGPALSAGMGLFHRDSEVRTEQDRVILLVSDGETMSVQYKPVAGVVVHTVGIDTAVDDAILKQVAKTSSGAYESILPGEDYDAAARRIAALAQGAVVTDIQIRGLSEGADVVGVGDLYRGKTRVIAAKLKNAVRGCAVTGRGQDGALYEWPVAFAEQGTTRLAALLWAQEKIRQAEARHEFDRAIELSLRYGILCAQTAFVAVSEKEVPGARPVRVDIPVLLPATWDYTDVCGGAPANLMAMSAISLGGGSPFVGVAAAAAAAAPAMRGGGGHGVRHVVARAARAVARSFSPDPGRPVAEEVLGAMADVGDVMALEVEDVGPPLSAIREPELLTEVRKLFDLVTRGAIEWEAADEQWQKIVAKLAVHGTKGFGSGWEAHHLHELRTCLQKFATYGFVVEIPREVMDA